jgi:membrane protease YdiL (CAAX protease family)
MTDPDQATAMFLVLWIAATGVLASLAMQGWIVARLRRRLPILPRQRRRHVPWGALDVFLVGTVYVATIVAVQFFDHAVHDTRSGQPAPPGEAGGAAPSAQPKTLADPTKSPKPDANHPLVILIRQDRSLTTFLWVFVAAVLVVPIVEEFLFRLVLQGWLEAVEVRLRWLLGFRRTLLGAGPVLAVSLIFAALHYREARPPDGVEALVRAIVRTVAAGLVTLLVAVSLLRGRAGATWKDLGIVPQAFWRDVRLGLSAFLTIAAPMYAIQVAVLPAWLPEDIAPDPITLALFSIVLGTLYCRTHRIVPAVTLHMALNATSLLLARVTLPLTPT